MTRSPHYPRFATALFLSSVMPFIHVGLAQAEDDTGTLEETQVLANRVANPDPAATFATPVTALRYDAEIEIQPRGLPEGQADITVRGSVFEAVGLRVGAASIVDPQTGHYAGALPIDPKALSAPTLAVDVDHALAASNATVATVQYTLQPLRDATDISLGLGSDGLSFQSVRAVGTQALDTKQWGVAISIARSEGDGTLPNGDHEFERVNLQSQWIDAASQTDLLVAKQNQFYGWPGAYTGFASLPETDDTETTLFFANHRRQLTDGEVEVTAFLRRLVDDYDFNRTNQESNSPGSYDHETRVWGLGLQGRQEMDGWHLRYSGQYSQDELVRSTDLTNGPFTQRNTLNLALIPGWQIERDGWLIDIEAGATWARSNRDRNVTQPIVSLAVTHPSDRSRLSLSYTETSQLPGYTALASPTSGLFGGNPTLAREEARQVTLAYSRPMARGEWSVSLFQRWDEALVDWTFSSASPFSRQANAVDLDVIGAQFDLRQTVGTVEMIAGLTVLDKDADYGQATIDASFYALNYAEQRATLALIWSVSDQLTLRWDNEYRKQAKNALRVGDRVAYFGAASLIWGVTTALDIAAVIDNLADDDFQFFVGTPGVGRQASLRINYQL